MSWDRRVAVVASPGSHGHARGKSDNRNKRSDTRGGGRHERGLLRRGRRGEQRARHRDNETFVLRREVPRAASLALGGLGYSTSPL